MNITNSSVNSNIICTYTVSSWNAINNMDGKGPDFGPLLYWCVGIWIQLFTSNRDRDLWKIHVVAPVYYSVNIIIGRAINILTKNFFF